MARVPQIVISILVLLTGIGPLGAEVRYKGEWVKITDQVYHFQRKVSSNSGAILMKDYAIVVDAGQEPESGKEAVEKLRKITEKPVKYVVITHYHDDHIMAIPWFKKQGAVVIAHEETNRIIREMGSKLIEQRINLFGRGRPELKEILRDAVIDVADLTFKEKMTIGSGDERVELLYFGPARTPSDIFLWLAKEKILFTGDAINKSVQPIHYDYPNIKQWTAAMRLAMELGPVLYLAGHGTPLKTDTVKEIIDYYSDLRKGVQAYIDKGVPLEKIQAEFQLPQYKDWPNYNERFKTHIMVMYKELTGQTKKFYDIK
ncbi:MAG: MBL fold metallo-hydrolase [Deltaproteobacteria bacterium]|nr:MBL fold metallo-hydrolase [Deltaproteobacteria bacterium]